MACLCLKQKICALLLTHFSQHRSERLAVQAPASLRDVVKHALDLPPSFGFLGVSVASPGVLLFVCPAGPPLFEVCARTKVGSKEQRRGVWTFCKQLCVRTTQADLAAGVRIDFVEGVFDVGHRPVQLHFVSKARKFVFV